MWPISKLLCESVAGCGKVRHGASFQLKTMLDMNMIFPLVKEMRIESSFKYIKHHH